MHIDEDKLPNDLDEAVDMLMLAMDEDDRASIARHLAATDDKLLGSHFGVGMYLRNNWNLWEDSPISRWFIKELKICHADDMSGIILDAFCHKFQGRSYDPHALAVRYHQHWDAYYGKNSADKMINEWKTSHKVSDL